MAAFFGVSNNLMADGAQERSGASETGPTAVARQLSHDKETSASVQIEDQDRADKRHEINAYGANSVPEGEKTSESEREEARRDDEVHNLARKLTQQSSYSEAEKNPFEAGEDSRLNPNSPNFSAKAWAKSLMHVQSQTPDNPVRTSGVAFRNLNVYGYGAETDYQQTVSSVWLQAGAAAGRFLGGKKQRRVDILRSFEGVVHAGEMLVVLGPPGSGCTTFLKTISGETHGFTVAKDSYINYQGVRPELMYKNFRGEAIYTAETDVHFPQMTVKDTLTFAARARAPRSPPGGVTPAVYSDHKRDVVMAMFGISHTANTVVGNDFVRGVSGGERKRVTIAEATLSGAPLQCWDNSTRGLDSANAVEFCKTLRVSTDILGATACVSIYQSPQSAYDLFNKALLIYEGRQIYFGDAVAAKQYFIDLGFRCPDRQTTADFLTSMTSHQERVYREGFENKAPKTPDDFAAAWKASPDRARLLTEIEEYEQEYAMDGEHLEKFKASRKAQQAKRQRVNSPFTLSFSQQIKLCLWRSWQRLKGDPSLTVVQIFSNSIMALVISSIFYNLQPDTNSFFQRGAVLFFAILMNAFGSALEILTLYAQRPIVEKHARYAFYHPSAEAFASMLMDLPYKIGNAIGFNLVLYFMVNLRRTPGHFFFFLLVTFSLTLTMSMLFRFIGSVSRTLAQAMAPTGVLMLAIIIYTGFAIPIRSMLGWARWINYLDPVAYGFESLMINEFTGRNFSCSNVLPAGPQLGYNTLPSNKICTVNGAIEGSLYVDGDRYIETTYAYNVSHKWRNVGIMYAFTVGLLVAYLVAAELVSSKKSKGEILVFRRGKMPAYAKQKKKPSDEEALDNEAKSEGALHKVSTVLAAIQKQTAVFSWRNVNYSVKIKKEDRQILTNIDGYVVPGTLTALMGVSGAGKTTLLDALATRTTMGVLTGQMLVDGMSRDESFQRKTGYVQQQDLHLETSTVREALNFSALLRQPRHIPDREKLEYVDEVIKLLDMQAYSDAVVGVPGTGLNVEQRKRLTIGVELAAKPELLLFLDEPTSGLDSQTSWAICDLMEKLTRAGQAILCTIHQPSAMLFQRFDRLLFLKTGGETIYFGEIGKNASTLTSYFERNGGFACPPDANPAEWMLEVIGAAPGSHSDIDWHNVWRSSPEYEQTQHDLDRLAYEGQKRSAKKSVHTTKFDFSEFAAPFLKQYLQVQLRVFQQYWRTPSYIYSKAALCTFSALFIGFSFFNATLSIQGLTNQMFSIFMLFTIFGQLCQQLMPHFVTQRSLYEVRERPSKAYSWKAFMLANIIVEIPWQTLMAVIMFFCWYYPVGFYRNAAITDTVHERGGLFFLLVWAFLVFTSTFAHMVIAAVETAEAGGNIANLMFSLVLIFCGVLASRDALPGFWQFMYYLSPFTWLVSALLSTGLANAPVSCADYEFLKFTPISGQTCLTYMQPWISKYGGYLRDNNARDECEFCSLSDTNAFLIQVSAKYENRWRNFGIIFGYIAFNVIAALFLYWLVRMPKKAAKTQEIAGSEENAPAKSISHKSQSSIDTPVVPAAKSTEYGSDRASTLNPGLEKSRSNAEATHADQNHAEPLDTEAIHTEPIHAGALPSSVTGVSHHDSGFKTAPTSPGEIESAGKKQL